MFLAGRLVLGRPDELLSDLWQMEPAFLVGHLAGNSRTVNRPEVERGETEAGEKAQRIWTGVLAI